MQNYKSYNIAEDDAEYVNDRDEYGIYYIRNPYKSLNSKFIENKNQFKLDLKLYPSQPRIFSLNHLKDYSYLIYLIPDIFTNLSTLIISKSIFQIEIFQYFLDNLKYLSNLELSDNHFLQYAQNYDQVPINWPTSLKKFKYYKNYTIYVSNKEKPISIKLDLIQNLFRSIHRFTPKFLPKLVSFEYELCIRQPGISSLSSFLELNPQIIELKVEGHTLHPQLFESFKYVYNLTSLILNFSNYNMREFEFNNLPALTTITRLAICLDYDSENIDKTIEKFPNLKELVVEMFTDGLGKLADLTTKFPMIKILTLKIHLLGFDIKELNFPRIENLKALDFVLNRYNYFNHINWNVDSCPSLNQVKFSLDKSQDPFDQQKLNRKFDNWKLVYSPYKITLYKTSQ